MLRETKKSSECLRMKSKNYANKRAITLVALILTIIIMLILLAVTISILVKSNIIGIGEQAADKTKFAYEKEKKLGNKITINGVEYDGIDGYIQGSTCTSHTYNESDWAIDTEPTCATVGKKYVICTTCNAKIEMEIEKDKINGHNYVDNVCTRCKDGATATTIAEAATKLDYYGKTVNYTCEGTDIRWKIFYAGTTPGGTTNNIYLIPEGGVKLWNWIYSNDGFDSTKFANSPAKNWLKYARDTSIENGYGYDIGGSNIEHLVVELLDTVQWTQFCNSEYADWAIGGPTLDMFVASWNQTQTPILYYNAVNDEGYTIAAREDHNASVWADVTGLSESGDLYFIEKFDGVGSTWESNIYKEKYFIASPVGGDVAFAVNCNGSIDCCSSYNECVLRPVVCLSSSVVLTTEDSLAGNCEFGLKKVQ